MSDYFKKNSSRFNFKKFVSSVIVEDVGNGDHTSLSIISPDQIGRMKLLVKEEGIIAGVEAAERIFKEFSEKIKVKSLIKDGQRVRKGDIVFHVNGPVLLLLAAERLVLNVMQRMSGIATKTYDLQKRCSNTKTKLLDTRKTTPGFRFFEKWAVAIGGGQNHRYGLYDMILIKDNHIDFAGGIDEAIVACKDYLKRKKLNLKIEVEVRSMDDIKAVMKHKGIFRILIDNFSPSATEKAITFIRGCSSKIQTESSGGISEKNIAAYAKTGVDFISVGALTHHVQSLDLSLKAY